jgi:hypothetical protein
MEPTVVTCSGSCTVTHVIDLGFSPFNLSPEAAVAIAIPILMCWSVGYIFRLIKRAIEVGDERREADAE